MKAVPDEECRRLGGHGAASGVRGPDAGANVTSNGLPLFGESWNRDCVGCGAPQTDGSQSVDVFCSWRSSVGSSRISFWPLARFSPAQLVHLVFLSQHSPRSHL